MTLSNMNPDQNENDQFTELAWLLDVTESRQALNEPSPIWDRSTVVTDAAAHPPPERHPYCEINLVLEGGAGYSMIEKEKVIRSPGELLLLGPGIPHSGTIKKFPMSFITIYFLPWVLIEMGPESDGVRILRRFTTQQPAAQRVVHLPPEHRIDFRRRFEEIDQEFSQH